MTHDDNIKFAMGAARMDDPKWAEAKLLPFPDQSELWPEEKIWRVVYNTDWPEVPYQAAHIPLPERDLWRPVGVVYEKSGRYYVNVKATHEGKALMIGKQLIKWELEKCENK